MFYIRGYLHVVMLSAACWHSAGMPANLRPELRPGLCNMDAKAITIEILSTAVGRECMRHVMQPSARHSGSWLATACHVHLLRE